MGHSPGRHTNRAAGCSRGVVWAHRGDNGVGTRWAKRHKGAQGRLSEKVRDMYVQQLHLLQSYIQYMNIPWRILEGSWETEGGDHTGTTFACPRSVQCGGWGPYPSSHDNVGIQNPTVHHPCRNSSRWKDLGSWLANLGCHSSWHFVAVLKLWLSDSRKEKKNDKKGQVEASWTNTTLLKSFKECSDYRPLQHCQLHGLKPRSSTEPAVKDCSSSPWH